MIKKLFRESDKVNILGACRRPHTLACLLALTSPSPNCFISVSWSNHGFEDASFLLRVPCQKPKLRNANQSQHFLAVICSNPAIQSDCITKTSWSSPSPILAHHHIYWPRPRHPLEHLLVSIFRPSATQKLRRKMPFIRSFARFSLLARHFPRMNRAGCYGRNESL